jgi:DNA polymerase epsilon subunit 1
MPTRMAVAQDGSLAELKGFELKRRGELKLIKIFQVNAQRRASIAVLTAARRRGKSSPSSWRAAHCRSATTTWPPRPITGAMVAHPCMACASSGRRRLDVLYSEGVDLEDDDLFDLISESKSMTKTLEEYGGAKSTATTTAKRLGEFLGCVGAHHRADVRPSIHGAVCVLPAARSSETVKDKGLNCQFIIVKKPAGARRCHAAQRPFRPVLSARAARRYTGDPVSQRAVPVAIFSAEEAIKKHFLRRWVPRVRALGPAQRLTGRWVRLAQVAQGRVPHVV